MTDDKKKHSDDEEGNISSGHSSNQTNEQKNVELTEDQRRQRAFETQKLFDDKEDLIKTRADRERRKREEIIELQSGYKFTVDEVERIVSIKPQPYEPLFPYSVSFFKELYRLYYPGRDYKEYPKPFYFHRLFKELIYDRFDKSVYIAIDALNPIVKGKCRERRLFQHLKAVGRSEEEQFRDDVIEVAESVTKDGDWYAFRKKMWELYKVPYQLDFFKEKKKN